MFIIELYQIDSMLQSNIMYIPHKQKIKCLQNPESPSQVPSSQQQTSEKTSQTYRLKQFEQQLNIMDSSQNQFLKHDDNYPNIYPKQTKKHKFDQQFENKNRDFHKDIEPIVHSAIRGSFQELQGTSVKVYPKFIKTPSFPAKQPSRVTFGPDQFETNIGKYQSTNQNSNHNFLQKQLQIIPQIRQANDSASYQNEIQKGKKTKKNKNKNKSIQKQIARSVQKQIQKQIEKHLNLQQQKSIAKSNQKQKQKSPHLLSEQKSMVQTQIEYEKKKRPKVYEIMCRQIGMSEQKVFKLKTESLNYELDKFIRKKGLEYLEENRDRNKRVTTQTKEKYKQREKEKEQLEKESGKTIQMNKVVIFKNVKRGLSNFDNQGNSRENSQKGSQAFPQIKKRNSSKKTIFSQGGAKSSIKYVKNNNLHKSNTKKQLKYRVLGDQQQMLGKIVYDKVQDYFKLDKQKKGDYYTKVKTEEQIDEAWIQLLRTKVDRANLALK